MAEARYILELRDVDVVLPGSAEPLIRGMNCGLQSGDLVCLAGRSGCGKSTLLEIAAGLQECSGGSVWWWGSQLSTWTTRERESRRASSIGWVDQEATLINELSVFQNIALPRGGLSRRERRARSIELVDRLGLSSIVNRYPTSISGGERQRVAIARALMSDPELLVLDEPTSSLDEASTYNVIGLLNQVRADGSAILVSSHDPLLIHESDRVIHIGSGIVRHVSL